MRILMGAVFIIFSNISWGLDKGHFANLSPSDFEYVLKSFQSVIVYYPKAYGTGNVLTQLKGKDPKVFFKSEYILNLFYSPVLAAKFGGDLAKGHLGTVDLVSVLKDQFKQRNVQNTKKNPLFVIRQNMAPIAETYEYLGRKDGSPYIINVKNEKVILAGATQKLSLMLVKVVEEKETKKKNKNKIHRIGLDVKSFIKFIVAQGKQGVTVKVFGYHTK